MNGGVGDERNGDFPWTSVFDPAANARAFTAIQAEGFRAASQIVDRFVRIASTGLNGDGQPASTVEPPSDDQRTDLFGATDVEPLIRSWWSVLGQLFIRSAPPHAPIQECADPTMLEFSNAKTPGQLSVEAYGPGAVTADLWLHNSGVDDMGEVHLRCSDLLCADGSIVTSSAMVFDPATIPMPARSSRGISLTIELDRNVEPGLYRGNLLVEGHPQLWLPVVLAVHPSAS